MIRLSKNPAVALELLAGPDAVESEPYPDWLIRRWIGEEGLPGHVAQYLLELIEKGRLAIDGEVAKRVTYHDPCYLGRHNGLYDQPREVLKALPGVDLVEMPESRESSLCCGGGGGRIWMDTPVGERFSDLRLEQAKAVGADVLVTSCPYCISNFEASKLTLGEDDPLVIQDIAELICDGIEVGS